MRTACPRKQRVIGKTMTRCDETRWESLTRVFVATWICTVGVMIIILIFASTAINLVR